MTHKMKASQCSSRRASRQCWRPRAAPALGPATQLVARLAAIPATLQPGIVCVIAFIVVMGWVRAADMREQPALRAHLEVLRALLALPSSQLHGAMRRWLLGRTELPFNAWLSVKTLLLARVSLGRCGVRKGSRWRSTASGCADGAGQRGGAASSSSGGGPSPARQP